jgi:hypothetical protein
MFLKYKKYFFGGMCVFVLLPFSFVSAAEDSFRLTTSPIPISLAIEPGQSVSADIRIKNDGNKSEHLRVGVLPFVAQNDSGQPKIIEPRPEDKFLEWMSFSETEFDVSPGEWHTIKATITLPSDAAFSYFYAVTFSRTEGIQTGVNTRVIGSSAVLVLLEARVPNAVRALDVLDFSTDRLWVEFLPINFKIRLTNRGNVHISPRGNIFINRGKARDLAVLDVNSQQGNVLPDSERVFGMNWADGFPVYRDVVSEGRKVLDSKGQVKKELIWDFSQAQKLRWGKYDATLLLVYDDGTRDVPIEAHTSFWVIPWRIILVLFFIVLFMLLGVFAVIRVVVRIFVKKKKKEEIKQDEQTQNGAQG